MPKNPKPLEAVSQQRVDHNNWRSCQRARPGIPARQPRAVEARRNSVRQGQLSAFKLFQFSIVNWPESRYIGGRATLDQAGTDGFVYRFGLAPDRLGRQIVS